MPTGAQVRQVTQKERCLQKNQEQRRSTQQRDPGSQPGAELHEQACDTSAACFPHASAPMQRRWWYCQPQGLSQQFERSPAHSKCSVSVSNYYHHHTHQASEVQNQKLFPSSTNTNSRLSMGQERSGRGSAVCTHTHTRQNTEVRSCTSTAWPISEHSHLKKHRQSHCLGHSLEAGGSPTLPPPLKSQEPRAMEAQLS